MYPVLPDLDHLRLPFIFAVLLDIPPNLPKGTVITVVLCSCTRALCTRSTGHYSVKR